MAVYTNTNLRWYVGQQAVACLAKSATLQSEAAALDTTAICVDGWTTLIGGLKSGAFNMDLMADFVDDGLDENLFAALGTPNVPQSFAIGSTVGSVGYTMKSLSSSYVPVTGQPGELAMASLSGSSSGPIARGVMLASDTSTVSSSGVTTAVQFGALSSGQTMYVGLHVVTASGTSPTLDVVIQSDDSAGFASPTGRLTLTQATASTNRTQAGAIAGAVADDWWRVSYTIGGTTPVFAFAVVVGIG
jgi:hypothetical protein